MRLNDFDPEVVSATVFMMDPRTRDRLHRHGIAPAVISDVLHCLPVDGAAFTRELLALPAGKVAELNEAAASS